MNGYSNAKFICDGCITSSLQMECPGETTYRSLFAREVYQAFEKVRELKANLEWMEARNKASSDIRDELRAENANLHKLLDEQMQMSANNNLAANDLQFRLEQTEAALAEAVGVKGE